MKLFPHILARVGGTTFSRVKDLSFREMAFVENIFQKEKALKLQFENVLQSFELTIEEIDNYRLISILKNARKDFKNHKSSTFKKLWKANQNELFSDLLLEISVYLKLKNDIEKLKKEFDLLFQKEELNQYSILKAFFQNEDYLKGILQSSHSLYNQSKKLILKEPKYFKKKERQTVHTLAQYFYRIGTKTSPFSHFTTLDILSNRDGLFKNNKLKPRDNLYQYNNFILVKMKNNLLTDPSFFRQLKIQVNPTIVAKNNEYHFLKNIKNVESNQQIEASELLEELCQNIITNNGVSFKTATVKLLELVEADKEGIENYLLELIDVGFLEWEWGFSGLTYNWELQLHILILSMDEFLNRKEWIACLEKMLRDKKQMGSPSERFRYKQQIALRSDLEKLGLKDIIPELLFFEDIRKKSSIQLSELEIKPIIESLDSLLRLLEPLVQNEMKNRILNCWSKNFSCDESVPLMIFYEKIFHTPFDNRRSESPRKGGNLDLFKKIKLGIKENGRVDKIGNLHFSTNQLKSFFPKKNNQDKSQYSGLFQFYKKDRNTKAVINGLTPGFGKLFGRFLPLFNDNITIQLQKWNSELQGKGLWVENVDASIFNANLHPPLLSFEILNSVSQNSLPLENRISIKDLEVRWDENLEQPVLSSSETKERVTIFDFGFEHPDNRSPMFQLLNGFSISHATYRTFLELANEIFIEEKPNDVKCFKRIVIDENLILQRQIMEVSISFFPKKEKGESNSSYFLKIQKWKTENKIPQFIFIKPISGDDKSTINLKRDFYKPQLIDLYSPIAIVLLQKIIEKYSGRIRIVEMLPSQDETIGESVSEFAIQWKVD